MKFLTAVNPNRSRLLAWASLLSVTAVFVATFQLQSATQTFSDERRFFSKQNHTAMFFSQFPPEPEESETVNEAGDVSAAPVPEIWEHTNFPAGLD